MFFQATRPGAPTVGLGVLLLLSLTYILTTSWPGDRARISQSPVRSTPLEPESLLYPQVIVTGDSIAERSFENGPGYGSTLVSMYAGRMDVFNRGFGGYNSRQLLQKFREDMPFTNVKLFVIDIGTNDAVLSGSQSIDGDEYQRNVWDILDHIAEYHPAAHVVCITPSTLHPEQWMTHMQQVAGPDPASAYTELDRSVQNNKRYAGLMKGIIREWNKSRADVRDGNLRGNGKKVAVIDAFRAHSIAKGQHGVTNEQLFTDGLHWTAKGYEIVTREITRMLPMFEDIIASQIGYGFEGWLEYGAQS